MGPVLFWLLDNTLAVAFGYYIGNYVSKGERELVDKLAGVNPRLKVVIGQQDAANKARHARDAYDTYVAGLDAIEKELT
jgi:hypothetical protein